MRKIIIMVAILTVRLFSADYFDNKIVVKLVNYSDELSFMKNNQSIDVFNHYLGDYSVRYFVDERLLNQIDRKYLHMNMLPGNEPNHLRRIFVLTFNENYDPRIIASKLSLYPYVEYAEPLYKHRLTSYPNDLDYDKLYHIPQIKADSAWTVSDTANKVVLAIVDTGVDYLHLDLKNNIFINYGEFGVDENGVDLSTNGIDDDENGYIDDWRGWDFAADDTLGHDNDPAPGNSHGTHVAGTAAAEINNITGVAGVANNALILPVKIGLDDPNSRSTFNSYDGILYAALVGADVINCSWGSSSASEAERDIINEALSYGSIIVAAAGNDGLDTEFYPASYDGVLSVSAVDSNDFRAWWSNYNYSVGIAAPGVDIFSTVPNSVYQRMSGTSMASPVVAGVAAMVKGKFKDAPYYEIIDRIKATADDIYNNNSNVIGKLGNGRVNAYRAMTDENPKYVNTKSIITKETVEDDEYNLSEDVKLQIQIRNNLTDLENLNIKVSNLRSWEKSHLTDYVIGNFKYGEEIITDEFVFTLPDEAPYNFKYQIILDYYDGEDYINSAGTYIIINPSYKTFDGNNITATVTSQGGISFNDYPDNQQGEGFRYKNSRNLSYEGALMIARDTFVISNVARGSYQLANNRDFKIVDAINKITDNNSLTGRTVMNDDLNDTTVVGVEVIKNILQTNDDLMKDVIFISYDIINRRDFYIDSLFAGLYFDWDIGPDVHKNITYFDENSMTGVCKNVETDTVPVIGAKLISKQALNFFAIDNNGSSYDNPGVYDGFTWPEKWRTLSSGIARSESNVTDASMVISGGPITLDAGDTIRVTFAFFAADNENQLFQTSELIDKFSDNYINADGDFLSLPIADLIENIYPNPLSDEILTIEYKIKEETDISIDLFDMTGKYLENFISDKPHQRGHYYLEINPDNYSAGVYFIRFKTESGVHHKKLIIQDR